MIRISRLRAIPLLLPLAAIFIAAPPAQADPLTILNCPFAATATLDPGLGLLPSVQDIGGTVTFGTKVTTATPCSSPTGVPFVGGTAKINGSGTMACIADGGGSGGASGTADVKWFDHDDHVAGHSTITWSATVSGIVPVLSVSITSGDLAGSTILAEPILTGFAGSCVVDPIVSLSFAGDAQFIKL